MSGQNFRFVVLAQVIACVDEQCHLFKKFCLEIVNALFDVILNSALKRRSATD